MTTAQSPSGLDTEHLVVDPAFPSEGYAKLGVFEVELDPDPLILGPKRLNNKIAEARNMLTLCERLYLDVAERLAGFKRAKRKGETYLELAKKRLYANDPEVRAGRSVADRDALATGKLQAITKEVHRLELGVLDLEELLTVVKAKRSDLRDTQGRLRDQLRLCQEEINLGGAWGSQRPGAGRLDPGHVPDEVAQVESLFDSVADMGETHVGPEVEDELEIPDPEEVEAEAAYAEPIPAGTLCSVCGEPQMQTPSGLVCSNGHGGAPSLEEPPTNTEELEDEPKEASASESVPASPTQAAEAPAAEEALPGTTTSDEVADFLASGDLTEALRDTAKKVKEPSELGEIDDSVLESLLEGFE